MLFPFSVVAVQVVRLHLGNKDGYGRTRVRGPCQGCRTEGNLRTGNLNVRIRITDNKCVKCIFISAHRRSVYL